VRVAGCRDEAVARILPREDRARSLIRDRS